MNRYIEIRAQVSRAGRQCVLYRTTSGNQNLAKMLERVRGDFRHSPLGVTSFKTVEIITTRKKSMGNILELA